MALWKKSAGKFKLVKFSMSLELFFSTSRAGCRLMNNGMHILSGWGETSRWFVSASPSSNSSTKIEGKLFSWTNRDEKWDERSFQMDSFIQQQLTFVDNDRGAKEEIWTSPRGLITNSWPDGRLDHTVMALELDQRAPERVDCDRVSWMAGAVALRDLIVAGQHVGKTKLCHCDENWDDKMERPVNPNLICCLAIDGFLKKKARLCLKAVKPWDWMNATQIWYMHAS